MPNNSPILQLPFQWFAKDATGNIPMIPAINDSNIEAHGSSFIFSINAFLISVSALRFVKTY